MTPDRIKSIRLTLGLSASAMAEYIGLKGTDGRYVRAIEDGERNPSGPVVRILEMIEASEMPTRYEPAVRRRGRPPKKVEL